MHVAEKLTANPRRIVTIWNTYGRYHMARVNALKDLFPTSEIHCFSHCAEQPDYLFFNFNPANHLILVNRNARDLTFWGSFYAAIRALFRVKPDLVLTCGYERPESLAAVLYAWVTAAKTFLMLDNQFEDRPRHWLVETVKRTYMKFFQGFIYGGDTNRDYLRRLRVKADKEVHGYNCVDNDLIYSVARELRKDSNRATIKSPYFLCVARLIPKKNLLRLLDAYEIYRASVAAGTQPWRLVLAGDGPLRDSLRDAIAKKRLEELVTMLGRIDDFKDIINLHTFAQAVMLVSHVNEQWGLVINEAMAAGRPVIVSHQCGCASSLVVNKGNGIVVDGFDDTSIAAAMTWMHANEHLLDRMGERARESVSRVSPYAFACNVELLYQRVRPSRSLSD